MTVECRNSLPTSSVWTSRTLPIKLEEKSARKKLGGWNKMGNSNGSRRRLTNLRGHSCCRWWGKAYNAEAGKGELIVSHTVATAVPFACHVTFLLLHASQHHSQSRCSRKCGFLFFKMWKWLMDKMKSIPLRKSVALNVRLSETESERITWKRTICVSLSCSDVCSLLGPLPDRPLSYRFICFVSGRVWGCENEHATPIWIQFRTLCSLWLISQ